MVRFRVSFLGFVLVVYSAGQKYPFSGLGRYFTGSPLSGDQKNEPTIFCPAEYTTKTKPKPKPKPIPKKKP